MTTKEIEKIDVEPGIYTDISFEDYRRIDAINSSTLKKFMEESPFHYKYKKETGQLWDDTKSLSEGRVIHEAVLEPKQFKEKFVEEPTDWREYEMVLTKQEREYCIKKEKEAGKEGGMDFVSANSNAYKSIMTAFEGKIEDDKYSISPGLLSKCRQIRENIKENTACQKLFDGSTFETTLVWIDEETGLKCKGRLDVDPPNHSYMCDIKTTRSTHPVGFSKDVRRFKYNAQAAFYIDGAKALGREFPKAFVWIAVENNDPYYILPFYAKTTSDWITEGRVWYRDAIEKLHYCKTTGDWHGYHDRENDSFEMFELPEMNYY